MLSGPDVMSYIVDRPQEERSRIRGEKHYRMLSGLYSTRSLGALHVASGRALIGVSRLRQKEDSEMVLATAKVAQFL